MMFEQTYNRRSFFNSFGTGLGGAALLALCDSNAAQSRALGNENEIASFADLQARASHFQPKAKCVIQLFMNGGPSQMDLFDPKPMLEKHHGEAYFGKIAGEVENPQSAGALMRSPFRFAKRGNSGMWISDVMPHLAKQADSIAMIRSMYTTNLTHEPAVYFVQSGKTGPGRPALGSWVVYGLGSESQNLPAYVVLDDPLGLPVNGTENWQSGFLSPMFQGTRLRSTGAPVLNLQADFDRPPRIPELQRELIAKLDRAHLQKHSNQPILAARTASYELAARMQLAASDATDISKETKETQELYGIGKEPTDSYGRRCLIARRMVERGVRFVQIYINQHIWDNHTELASGLKNCCDRTDQPFAALLQDLKRTGLFESTLVVWGGEFGRLPIAQLPADKDERHAGRDHNKNAFTCLFAGAGIKAGTVHGATDELGFTATEDRVSVHDWHATILHLLGIDHERLFVMESGLREKLTGVEKANLVQGILE
jgi:hypothetical protein